MNKKLNIAIAGNPNSGKTTIFNAITGAHQHVGNYPGVTVERKEGTTKHKGYTLNLIDLPGTYSLTAYTAEELVARDYIIDARPDVVIDVIDSSNAERNLYLATQLMEMNVPLLFAFNMSDIAEQRGLKFDNEMLSEFFGAKVVMTIGSKSKGIDALLDAIIETAEHPPAISGDRITYGHEIEEELEKIQSTLDIEDKLVSKYGKRWLALKLLENDRQILQIGHDTHILDAVNNSRKHLKPIFRDDPEIIIAEHRYGFISGACQQAIQTTTEMRHDFSDQIDRVLTHRKIGLPIFVAMMYVVFQLTFYLGQYPMAWLESIFAFSAGMITQHWPGAPDSPLLSLIVDGIIGGVGGVVVFLPNILLLFMSISILEDSGYMARAAFLMDRIMHKIGLHGKSFIPMLIGFGCSVPAIMSTRILENRRSRLTTIMIIPLMSCGARLPIYTLFVPAFFAPKYRGGVFCLIYFIGIVLAIVVARILRTTLFRGETTPFVMELPPYRVPTVRGVLIHMWQRGWMYLRKAGTVILAISIVLWAASTYPKLSDEQAARYDDTQLQTAQMQNSIVGRVGVTIEPVLRPLGFDWKVSTALVGAFAAKEVFVSQMGIIYSLEHDESAMPAPDSGMSPLQAQLSAEYSSLQAFCIMLFCLISMPCIATVAMTKQEAGGWRWAFLQIFGLTALAYIVTLVVYQAGQLILSF